MTFCTCDCNYELWIVRVIEGLPQQSSAWWRGNIPDRSAFFHMSNKPTALCIEEKNSVDTETLQTPQRLTHPLGDSAYHNRNQDGSIHVFCILKYYSKVFFLGPKQPHALCFWPIMPSTTERMSWYNEFSFTAVISLTVTHLLLSCRLHVSSSQPVNRVNPLMRM